MRVKVGDTWFEVTAGSAIMVELTDADKKNLANMAPRANRYALFSDDDERTADERAAWMDTGAQPRA